MLFADFIQNKTPIDERIIAAIKSLIAIFVKPDELLSEDFVDSEILSIAC